MDIALPIGFVIALWWGATGLVLLLDSLDPRTFRRSLSAASMLAFAALAVLVRTRSGTTSADAYLAFSSAIVVWGWQELAFLTGAVTGPRKHACAPNCHGWQHFIHGCQAMLYHEALIALAALVLSMIAWQAENPVGLWTFLVLWVMRQSAKLNLFLGVRNLGVEFLPPHLHHLTCYFRRRAMNPLFPFSIAVPSAVLYVIVQRAMTPNASEFEITACALVGTLLGLAILEHVFLVIPLPASWLWGRRPAMDATTAIKT